MHSWFHFQSYLDVRGPNPAIHKRWQLGRSRSPSTCTENRIHTFRNQSKSLHRCENFPEAQLPSPQTVQSSHFISPRLNLVPALVVPMAMAVAFSEFGAVAHAFTVAGLAAGTAVVGGCTTVSVIDSQYVLQSMRWCVMAYPCEEQHMPVAQVAPPLFEPH